MYSKVFSVLRAVVDCVISTFKWHVKEVEGGLIKNVPSGLVSPFLWGWARRTEIENVTEKESFSLRVCFKARQVRINPWTSRSRLSEGVTFTGWGRTRIARETIFVGAKCNKLLSVTSGATSNDWAPFFSVLQRKWSNIGYVQRICQGLVIFWSWSCGLSKRFITICDVMPTQKWIPTHKMGLKKIHQLTFLFRSQLLDGDDSNIGAASDVVTNAKQRYLVDGL